MATETTIRPGEPVTATPPPRFAIGQRVRIKGGCRTEYTIERRRRYGGESIATWDYLIISPFGMPCGYQFERFLEAV